MPWSHCLEAPKHSGREPTAPVLLIVASDRPITFGQPTRRLHANGFVLTESVYRPRSSIPRHAHDNAVWVYVVEGSVVSESRGDRTKSPATSVRCVPAGKYHANSYGDAPCRCLLIEFEAEQARRIGAYSDILSTSAAYGPSDSLSIVARQIYAEFTSPDLMAPLAIESLLLAAIARASRRVRSGARSAPRWLLRIRDAIEASYRDGVAISTVSVAEGVHPVHAARMFRRHFGCTPSGFARMRRLQFAAEALRTRTDALSTIACDAGFADQSHLTREFRRAFGVTPAQFRRGLRSKIIPLPLIP